MTTDLGGTGIVHILYDSGIMIGITIKRAETLEGLLRMMLYVLFKQCTRVVVDIVDEPLAFVAICFG